MRGINSETSSLRPILASSAYRVCNTVLSHHYIWIWVQSGKLNEYQEWTEAALTVYLTVMSDVHKQCMMLVYEISALHAWGSCQKWQCQCCEPLHQTMVLIEATYAHAFSEVNAYSDQIRKFIKCSGYIITPKSSCQPARSVVRSRIEATSDKAADYIRAGPECLLSP